MITERLVKNKYLTNVSIVKKDTTAYANLNLQLASNKIFFMDILPFFSLKKAPKINLLFI